MKKVAIIGTGIAGMACAHDLFDKVELTLYEKNDTVGGHTNTVLVKEGDKQIPIDTGFMVYNETTYPNLTRLFKAIGVPTQPTKMSFSVQHTESHLEFAGTGIRGLFAQRRNLLKARHWKLLSEINRFNALCKEVLIDESLKKLSLQDYCSLRNFNKNFRDQYLIPMSSAIWSCPPLKMLEFPVITLVRFFTNHRFLGLYGQLQWRTVVGGSKVYRDLLIRPFIKNIFIQKKIMGVEENESGVTLYSISEKPKSYDAAILATHADEALQILKNPSPLQKKLLSSISYQRNRAILHTDEKVMPRAKDAWASWNYRYDKTQASTTYWMNALQKVSQRQNYFVSINNVDSIKKNKIIQEIDYEHPLYTLEAIAAQDQLMRLNSEGNLFFCGSYFKYGFHEDALNAGMQAAEALQKRILKFSI